MDFLEKWPIQVPLNTDAVSSKPPPPPPPRSPVFIVAENQIYGLSESLDLLYKWSSEIMNLWTGFRAIPPQTDEEDTLYMAAQFI